MKSCQCLLGNCLTVIGLLTLTYVRACIWWACFINYSIDGAVKYRYNVYRPAYRTTRIFCGPLQMSRNVDPLRSNYCALARIMCIYIGIANFIVPNHCRGPGTFCSFNPTLLLAHRANDLSLCKTTGRNESVYCRSINYTNCCEDWASNTYTIRHATVSKTFVQS